LNRKRDEGAGLLEQAFSRRHHPLSKCSSGFAVERLRKEQGFERLEIHRVDERQLLAREEAADDLDDVA